jgi:putative ABC transport system permease protein
MSLFYVRLAVMNVSRRYGRTSLSTISIIAGVAILILGRGFISGTKENMVRAQIDTMSGHVVAVPTDYPANGVRHPVDQLLEVSPDLSAFLDQEAEAWTRRTLFVARAVRGRDAMRLRMVGFDPATDEAVFPRQDWQVKGRVPHEDGVLVSKGVAEIFAIELPPAGEPAPTMVFEVRTSAGAINALALPVAGIVRTGNPMFDRIGCFAPQPVVDRLVVPEGRASHVAVRLSERGRSDAFAAALSARWGDGARVRTWAQEARSMIEIQDLRQRMLNGLVLLLMLIAATGIANTVLMAAYERVREIGTLRAMGLTRRGVIALFVGEGVVMGAVGGLIGAAVGGLSNWKLHTDGLDLSEMIETAGSSGAYENIPFSVMLYTEWSLPTIIGAALFGLAVAVLASIYPAFVATRMAPADAVRAE